MRKSPLHRRAILLVVFIAAGVVGTLAHKSESASLTSTSVTLGNSRISFRGQLGAGNTVGTSQVIIENANASPNTVGLVQGDILQIGSIATTTYNNYTISDVISSSTLAISSALGAGDADANDDVIIPQPSVLTVRFTTASAVNDGTMRVLIPAVATDADSSDGAPDQDAWDLNDIVAADVTCPTGVTNYTFGTPVVTPSVLIGSNSYHVIECPYTGTGSVGAAFQSGAAVMTIGDATDVTEQIINPAPTSGHTAGNADTYRLLVQNLDSGDAVVDSTTVSVGVIEAVRITASVAPQLTFTITGIASSDTSCGAQNTTNVTTTATTVPLGELAISSFVEAAQNLLVSTNASNGYVVTALANDQLGKDGEVCTGDPTANPDCIPDSPGDGAVMGPTTIDQWSLTATKGFAYTIHNNDAGSVPFQHSTATGGCTGNATNECYRQFADGENAQAPATIFSHTTVADSQDIDLCYRAIISASQAAGNYENYVTYTATATF